MAGFIPFALAGVAFLLIAAIQTLTISSAKPHIPATLHHHLSAAFSLALLLTAAYYSRSADPLHLQLLPVAALFLLHSLASPHLPDPIPHLLALSAFSLQFLLLHLRRPHPDGLKNRYFDLLLVPVALSLLSALLAVVAPASPAPLLAGAAALALQGTWFIQMAFSFFTDAVSHGCSLRQVSLGDFTLRCPAHMDAHRAAAVATLQFNCHLAGLLVLFVGLYALFRSESGGLSYRPINQELQRLHTSTSGKFTMVSDGDDEAVDLNGVSAH